MTQKNRHKNVAVFAVFLVSSFSISLSFSPCFLLISCCFMLSWNPKTAHQVRLQAFRLSRAVWDHQDFPKGTRTQMEGVLQYKWEAYCDTNGRSTDSICISSGRRGTESLRAAKPAEVCL